MVTPRFRFSLLWLLIFVTVLATGLGYLSSKANRVNSLQSKVKSLGGAVICRHDLRIGDGTGFVPDGAEYVPDDAPLDASRQGMPQGWLAEPVGVDLSQTQADDADVQQIVEIAPTLEGISLSLTRISDRAAAMLSTLSNLRNIDLACTGITDVALEHLSKVSKLQELDIAGAAVTDRGLRHLYKVKTLQYLNLVNTKVTDDGVQAIQEALPQCQIGFDSW
jgi:hypothetical protein